MDSSSSIVFVAGATGFLGGEICRQLISKNKRVRGLIRKTSDPARVEQLKNMGVETVEGDLKDPASLRRAVRGVDAVISTTSSTLSRQEGDSIDSVDDRGQGNLIEASVDAGVSHFVYISFCDLGSDFPLQHAKRKNEKLLSESGINYTILRPTCFMEIWLGPALGFDYANSKATLYGEGTGKLSWIAVKDVATYAVESLENDKAARKSIDIGGPDSLSQMDVVRIFEEIGASPFDLSKVPEDALRSQKEAAPDPLSESFASLMLSVAKGDNLNTSEARNAFDFPLTSVKQYARQVLEDAMSPQPH